MSGRHTTELADLRALTARAAACRIVVGVPRSHDGVIPVVDADGTQLAFAGAVELADYIQLAEDTPEAFTAPYTATRPRAVVTDGDRTVVDDRSPAGLTAADYASAAYDADNSYFDALDAADAQDAAEQPRPEHPLIVDLRRELDDTSIPPISRERITTVVDRLAKTLAGVDLAATLISSYLDDLSEALDLGEPGR